MLLPKSEHMWNRQKVRVLDVSGILRVRISEVNATHLRIRVKNEILS